MTTRYFTIRLDHETSHDVLYMVSSSEDDYGQISVTCSFDLSANDLRVNPSQSDVPFSFVRSEASYFIDSILPLFNPKIPDYGLPQITRPEAPLPFEE